MNKNIMEAAGFGSEVKDIEAGLCPFCKKEIKVNQFRDRLSLKEYHISGLCQSCQDDVFKGE